MVPSIQFAFFSFQAYLLEGIINKWSISYSFFVNVTVCNCNTCMVKREPINEVSFCVRLNFDLIKKKEPLERSIIAFASEFPL
jgi:hypothetical protein